MNDKAQKLYDLYLSQGLITEATSFDRFSSATPDQQEKLYELGKSEGLFESATVDDFKSAFQPQEELTPEVVDAAEKKSPTESPLQDGVSADVVEEPVAEEEPVGIFPVEEDTAEEVPEEPVGIFPTEEVYKAKVPDFEDYGKKILSGEMTIKDIKTPDQIFEDKILKKELSEVKRINTNISIDFQKSLNESQEVKEAVSRVSSKYQSQYQDKFNELTNLVNSGEISEGDANIELSKFSSIMDERIADEINKDPQFVKESERLQSLAIEESERQIEELSKELSIDRELYAKEKIAQLGFWEGIGNALHNEYVKTKMLPLQNALYNSQIAEDQQNFTASLAPLLTGGRANADEFKSKFREAEAASQIRNYQRIKDYEKELKDVVPTWESIKDLEGSKILSGAVSNSIQFIGSIMRSVFTEGGSAMYEMGTPMYIDAVEAKAKRDGKTPEEIIYEDSEDELTSMTLGVMAGALEKVGIGQAVGFAKNKILKKAVENEIKSNRVKIGKELWGITKSSLTEVGTEVPQGALEEYNRKLQEKGIVIGTKGSGTTLFEAVGDFVESGEAAETAVSTLLGSMLMFGTGRGARLAISERESIDVDGKKLSFEDFQSFLDNATDEQIAAAKIDIKGNDALKKVAEQKKKDIREDAIIKRDLAEAGITDAGRVSELVPLEKEKKKLQGNTTEAGKKKLQEINAQIDEVMAKEPTEEVVTEEAAPTYEAPTQVTSPTAEEFATVNRNDGKGTVTLTEDEYNAEMEKFAPVEEVTDKQQSRLNRRVEKAKEAFANATDIGGKVQAVVSFLNNATVSEGVVNQEDMSWYEQSKAELEGEGYVLEDEIGRELSDNEVYEVRNKKESDQVPKGVIIVERIQKPRRVVDGKQTERAVYDVIVGTGTTTERETLAAEVEAIEDSMTPQNIEETRPKLAAAKQALKEYDDANFTSPIQTEINTEQDAIQEPSTETVDVQEPTRDRQAVGEGDVRETTEEVDTEDQKAKIKQEADDLADALGLDDDVKFQLETDMTDKQRKETLEKEAEDLMNEVQPENVETIESVEEATPIPVNLEENVDPVNRTGIKRFKLKDIIGKKLNLLMADKLKIELKDPSKPYDQETNPYVKMGGNFFPLMEKIFGRAAWASIDKTAANKIIIGAMNGDLSVVYNMGDGGVDSNIAMAEALDNAIPENRKDEIFQLIKERVLGSDEQKIKKAHKHFKDAKTLMEAFESLANTESIQKDGTMKKEGVDVRAAVTRLIIPTGTKGSRIDLHVKLKELGVTIEKLREENAEQFAKELPDGALTMVVEVQDENGVPVRERKLAIDKELADGKITDKEYEAKYNAIIDSARMSVEQQQQEGIPSHRNYPVYIRGRAVGIMEETASFFNVIPEYRQKINERVSGIDKKKTGKVKEGATKVEESIYNQIKEAKKDSTSVDSKKEIIKELLKGEVKKLKSGEVKSQTISLLKSALKLNNKAGIKEILTKAETPFAETTQYSAGEMRSAAMSSAMGTSTTAYEVVEYLKGQHERFLGRLSKAFPTVDVVLSQNEFNAIIANARAKKLVTANQKVYGAVYEGKLYLNPSLPNYNTPIHEFGHVWLNVARELGKDTYKKGMELMTKDSPYYQQVVNSKEYGKIIDKMRKDGVSEADIETYIKEEALATAIGDKGESFASAAQKKNFKNWLNELFEFIGKLTGISELTPDQLQNITLDEFVQSVVVDLMSENEVFAGAEVKSFGEQLQLMTVPDNSMNKIIEFGRAENFSDASIKELLKKRGFKVADINKAMVVNIDIETQLPSEFNRVKGGVGEATQMFKDVRKNLSTFAKGKRKKIPAKKLTADEKRAKANELRQLNPSLFDMSDDAILKKFPEPAQYEVTSAPTMSEVRAKAIELLKAHPVFQKQSAAVQGAILVGFDKTIGTKSNKKVQDVINNIKNKAKAMREGVKSIKEAQKELKAALKEMPMSQDIRRIIKAVGDVNQDNVLAQLERISELVDNIKSKEAVSDAQKRALQMKIAELKKNAKDLATLKGEMRRFIRMSLPLSNMYTKSQLDKVAAIIDKTNFDNQVEQVQKVLDIVETQREKMKKATVKRMLDKAKKYATKKRTGKLVAKAGSVEAQGQMFFEEAAKILKYAYNNDIDSMLKLAQELSDLDGIDEIVQKEINGEKLTQQEQALLDRVYAFDTFGDIMSMDLEDVMTLEEAVNDVKNESAVRLKNARLERSERYAKLSKESNDQIKKGFRELFTINGILKTKNQLNKTSKAIYEEFQRNGTVAAAKKLINEIGYSQYNPVSLVRNLLLHMGTMSTILDKGGTFFTDNIVTPLKDANESNLKGYQQQIQKLDDLANAVKGIDGGFKQVMKLLKGKGMFVAGIEQSEDAQIASIKAMVDENPTDPKTLAKAKKLIAEVVTDKMKYLGMSKSDIKAQIKAINETIDATTLVKEQVKFIEEISKLKQVNGITLTKDQLLRVYALSKNDVQREKLRGQGFTDERMAEIEQFLGPELIAFADNVVDYLSGQYYESVNDVHVRVNDVNLDFVENYFPTRSLRGIKPTEYGADNFAKSFSQMSPSAISQRVDTKSGIDLTETFASALKGHLQQMEKYKAYAETVNTIQKILAFDHVDALLNTTGLKKMYYLTIDNEVNPSSESMPFFQWLANRFYGMTLGFKLIQIPKQATSFINAYEQYSFFKDGKKKKLGVLGPDLIGFAYDYAKVLLFFRSNLKQARLNSATFNQRVIDAYQGDIFGLESGPQVTKEQRNEFIKWWNVASASPTTFGDILGVMGYMAVYNRNIANGMSPKEAVKIFNDYNETQQSRRGTEASPIQVMAKRNPLLRMMTMFSSTMLLQINKVYQSSTNVMRDISNKKVPSKRDIRSIYLNVGLANVLFVLAGNMMKLMDGDDEDKEEVYTEMIRAMLFMNQLKKIPAIGSAVAGIEAMVDGKRALPSIQGPLDRLTYDVAKSIKDEDYLELFKKALDFTSSTNLDMFQGIIQGATEGFEDEVIYDILGLPKSARPKGEKEKKGGSGGRFTTRSSTR